MYDSEEEQSAFDDGYCDGFSAGKSYAEKQFKDWTETTASALSAQGHPDLARSLREWALMSPHVRSFTPPL